MPREVGEWTKDKLRILELYLPGYLQATTRAVDRIYIDAFSGHGKNKVDATGEIIDGSPLIAMKASGGNGSRFTKLFFIDQDSSATAELSGHVSHDPRCEVLTGDVNQQLPRLLSRINQQAPTFVFLDTDGIEPRWSTIEAIAPWRVEFLVNFPLGMSINRNPNSEKTLAYFGTDECLPLLDSNELDRTRRLLDLYKGRLRDLGFAYTTEDDRLVKTQNNQRLYYLVFVSKVQPAKTIMNWVLKQPDSRGQARFEI